MPAGPAPAPTNVLPGLLPHTRPQAPRVQAGPRHHPGCYQLPPHPTTALRPERAPEPPGGLVRAQTAGSSPPTPPDPTGGAQEYAFLIGSSPEPHTVSIHTTVCREGSEHRGKQSVGPFVGKAQDDGTFQPGVQAPCLLKRPRVRDGERRRSNRRV